MNFGATRWHRESKEKVDFIRLASLSKFPPECGEHESVVQLVSVGVSRVKLGCEECPAEPWKETQKWGKLEDTPEL
jgi:hypothetical protein